MPQTEYAEHRLQTLMKIEFPKRWFGNSEYWKDKLKPWIVEENNEYNSYHRKAI